MAKVVLQFSADDKRHHELVKWWNEAETGERSRLVRQALYNEYIARGRGDQLTLADVVAEIRKLKAAGFTMQADNRPNDDMPDDIAFNLDGLGR